MKKFALLMTIATLGLTQATFAGGAACNHRAKLKMLDGSTVQKKYNENDKVKNQSKHTGR